MAPIASRMRTSTKKAGQGGSYSWGHTKDLADFEFVGVSAAPQVSVASVQRLREESRQTHLQNNLNVPISDIAHFPQLGSASPQAHKPSSASAKHACRRPPQPMVPSHLPSHCADKGAGLHEASSLIIDWSTSGLKVQRGAAVQQMLHYRGRGLQAETSSHAGKDDEALMIDWSVEGTKSQRTEVFQQSSHASDEMSKPCKSDFESKSSLTMDKDALTMMISQRAASFCQSAAGQQLAPTEQTRQTTNPEASDDLTQVGYTSNASFQCEEKHVIAELAVAYDVDTELAEARLIQNAENCHNSVTIGQTSYEESGWAFVDDAEEQPLQEEDVSFTIIPGMQVREIQAGFSGQRSRNTFARKPRRTANGKENIPSSIDWAAEGNLAFQQAARKLCVNPAHLGFHQTSKARSQTPHRAMIAHCRADHSAAKVANNAIASKPRRDRSRSLITQKRGR